MTYKFKKDSPSGNAAGENEPGKTPSEPEQSEVIGAAQNLWFNNDNIELSVPLESGKTYAKPSDKNTTKWTKYYDVDLSSGAVTVIPTDSKTRKTAANAKNSLIILNIMEGETIVGEFRYALPVFYQKPTLKLTSTSGTVNVTKMDGSSVAAQTLKTVVQEKKSTGAFEAIDLDDATLDYNLKKGTKPSSVVAGDNSGEVEITATGKASGKLSVKLDSWVEPIEVSYTVKEVKKNVLTGSTKTVTLNLNKDEDGQIQEAYYISAGLDYPGIGPVHCNLAKQKRAQVLSINDDEALDAAFELTKTEGIIPALESAHILAALPKMHFKPTDIVVLTVSGRGDKDMETYLKFRG